ncbi:unnamed protein product [Prunus armeniaca]
MTTEAAGGGGGGGLGVKLLAAANVTIPAMFMFGDSIVDTGNNNDNLKTPARCNFPPYGRDFRGGIPTGRYSNGKVPSDFIAEELGIKELLPAYLDPNLALNDLLTGVSFAVGATGYDPMTAKVVAVTTLSDQLLQFEEYIGKLKGIVGEDRANSILANSLFFVVASSNDLANTYFVTGIRKLEYDVPSYTDLMLNLASDFASDVTLKHIKSDRCQNYIIVISVKACNFDLFDFLCCEKGLYALGARRIGVFGAPPIGCLPSQRTLGGGMLRDCVEKPNQAAMLFNSKLSAELDDLNKNLPNSNLVYMLTSTTLYSISSSTLLITALKLRIKGVAGVGSWRCLYFAMHSSQRLVLMTLIMCFGTVTIPLKPHTKSLSRNS